MIADVQEMEGRRDEGGRNVFDHKGAVLEKIYTGRSQHGQPGRQKSGITGYDSIQPGQS